MPLTHYSMSLQTALKTTRPPRLISDSGFLPLMGPHTTCCLVVFFHMVAWFRRIKATFWATISCFHMQGKCSAGGLCTNAIMSYHAKSEEAAKNGQQRHYCWMYASNHWIPVLQSPQFNRHSRSTRGPSLSGRELRTYQCLFSRFCDHLCWSASTQCVGAKM